MSLEKNPGQSYASLRLEWEPNPLVVDALKWMPLPCGRALDIGAGALSDTRYLLQAGMTVDAVDTDPLIMSVAAELNHRHLKAVHDDVRHIVIEPEAYALVVAVHVLPFLPRVDLPVVISAIIDGLADDGIFCGTLFGVRDGWAGKRPLVTFLTESEVVAYFSRLLRITFSEAEYDGIDALGKPKHWHVFRLILRKSA
jgi:SAM-dependent methyltransferase